ncbi:MAG: T9SS type A sorting domain-containing protein [Ignavibacteria bacterium]|nr:T9SS type A sorting domain-containing protein [Ignavibacteria bacterium]
MLLIRTLLSLTLLVGSVAASLAAINDHGMRVFPSGIAVGQQVPASITGHSATTIVIRYLGYECTHCVRQLIYLNEHRADLKRLGITVIATSEDPQERWSQMVEKTGIDREVFRYVPDTDGSIARSLGALRMIDDTLRDLHAALVVKNSVVAFSVYSTEPFMEIDRIVSYAAPEPVRVEASVHLLDRYLTSTPTVSVIASSADGIRDPLDLDFNRTALHPNDLWVVTAESRGHAMTIIHNAGTNQQAVRQKKDSRANHFMWRTMGIAMGTNGAFGTAQNGEPGSGDANYMFMGPTLWSSDTAVFASRYQDDNTKLASHLDMLHQSPWGLGIAHDSANIFWVLDARYSDICRYDFRDPHEVGGTDHRDGIIRRYSDVKITPVERGRPSHVALNRATGLLYYIDPGTATVSTLNTRSGVVDRPLKAPPESDENYAEYTAVVGADVKQVISSGLQEPVGIDVVGDRLLVGDRATGLIHMYAIDGDTVRKLGTITTGASQLLGIVVGPDGRIWFVDKAKAMVGRLDLSVDNSLAADAATRIIRKQDSVTFLYTNGSAGGRDVQLVYRIKRHADGSTTDWSTPVTLEDIAANTTVPATFSISIEDSLSLWGIECAELISGEPTGLKASTILVPFNVRRAIVQDERVGTYNIAEAISQTSRTGYVAFTSDVFNVVADSLHVLKTVLWNSGSFGEIDMVDNAITLSLLMRKIEVFLIADDPLLLRTDLPNSIGFFNAFGCSLRGADQVTNDVGQRVFQGVVGDPVTAGMVDIDLQLPRLDHHRGGDYVPNVVFRLSQPGSVAMMLRSNATIIGSVRYQHSTYRSIILGVNASRFLDGVQRTTILDKGLVWLEAAAEPDTLPPDPTDVAEDVPSPMNQIAIVVGANPVVSTTSYRLVGQPDAIAILELYSLSGQRMATVYTGPLADGAGTLDVSYLPSGSYFLVVRANDNVAHKTIIVK